jgi:SAM-dependent methyltransferase
VIGVITPLVKAVLPARALRWMRARRQARRERALARMTPEQVFTDIYARNAWGGDAGEFSSGSGTRSEAIVGPYIATIARLAESRGFQGGRFVDLGCGDFRVGQRLLPLCSSYVGVDVVPGLIAHNTVRFGGETTSFIASDIIRDPLPTGDVCFIRQVLQHLSNDEIGRILSKLCGYSHVFITEHHPSPVHASVPNVDKVHGADVRAASGSGVYLDQPPFSLPLGSLELVLEVPGAGLGTAVDQGLIRTFLYTPGRSC